MHLLGSYSSYYLSHMIPPALLPRINDPSALGIVPFLHLSRLQTNERNEIDVRASAFA
jgi:hypothetical protein